MGFWDLSTFCSSADHLIFNVFISEKNTCLQFWKSHWSLYIYFPHSHVNRWVCYDSLTFMHSEERCCFSGSQEKHHSGNIIHKWLKCMCTHTHAEQQRTDSTLVLEPCQWIKLLKARKVNLPLEPISHCLAFLYSLFWSKVASPITFSLDTVSHCQHWDQRKVLIHVRAIHSPPFVFFRKLAAHVPLTGVFALSHFYKWSGNFKAII